MNLHILGIDISKAKFDIALFNADKIFCKKFDNSNSGFLLLEQWLIKKKVDKLHACLEATGVYGDKLAFFLHNKNHIVSVVNPAQIKGFAQSELARTKTDKADAKLIARFCKAINPTPWEPIPEGIKQLQSMVRRLDVLISMHRQECNRLEVSEEILLDSIQASIDFIESQIKDIKSRIKNHIDIDPDLKAKSKLLQTIPGVGDATIAQVLAFISEAGKFKSAKQVAAFIGLNPKHRISGSSVRGKAHLSKTGNSALRKAFYMPAVVAKNHNPVIKEFCKRLEAKGKHTMCIIGAAMRKLIHIIYGVLKSGKPFSLELCYS
ncbi:MAG TPA: IS110 family transposase [Gammaproteobacteria bacterium]|nr:IS110 family transposase [Gammaproteobacteria bacterium]